MSIDNRIGGQYSAIRNMYDANFDTPTQGAYNSLQGAVYELKSSHHLPNNMYDAVNNMQQSFGQQLGRLERKL